ncbi:MAG: hypothetical protein ACI9DC_004369 [Gammaproteobacteria bacterium]|jgi:hypothetical protein
MPSDANVAPFSMAEEDSAAPDKYPTGSPRFSLENSATRSPAPVSQALLPPVPKATQGVPIS